MFLHLIPFFDVERQLFFTLPRVSDESFESHLSVVRDSAFVPVAEASVDASQIALLPKLASPLRSLPNSRAASRAGSRLATVRTVRSSGSGASGASGASVAANPEVGSRVDHSVVEAERRHFSHFLASKLNKLVLFSSTFHHCSC